MLALHRVRGSTKPVERIIGAMNKDYQDKKASTSEEYEYLQKIITII